MAPPVGHHESRVSQEQTGETGQILFIEMGTGDCLVAGNVAACNLTDGIYCHDASGVTLAHNLLACNGHYGAYLRTVTQRPVALRPAGGDLASLSDWERTPVGCRGNRVLNNVFLDNQRGAISLPVEGPRSGGNRSDWNLFLNGTPWQWEGLGHGRFSVNINDSLDFPANAAVAQDLAADLGRALAAAGIPGFDPERFLADPHLSLAWWRAFTRQDLHSCAPTEETPKMRARTEGLLDKGAADLSPLALRLRLRKAERLAALACPRLPEIDRDWWGRPLPEGTVLPGPFQLRAEGPIDLALW